MKDNFTNKTLKCKQIPNRDWNEELEAIAKALETLNLPETHSSWYFPSIGEYATLLENQGTPKHNWGFRGLPGDEHQLNYKIEVKI